MRYPTVGKSIGLSMWLAVGLLVSSVVTVPTGPAQSRESDKKLKLYFGHTGERGEFTFKRNGRFDKKELARINKFLRDWRRNEPANMDPQLLDLIHSIYKQAGGRDYIHVVSAYRSLNTNNMLRSRSRGVAQKSQHTAGKAMDFYVPGVPLPKLRAAAMKFQRGGVGFYPASGSPFVHVDTGTVRYWPRMPRKQLLAMFPNGETLYLPADGKPLPGYDRALARKKSSGGTALAYLETGDEGKERIGGGGAGNWLKRVFSGGADEAEDNETAGATAAKPPAGKAAPAEAAPAEAAPANAAPGALPPIGEPEVLIASEDSSLEPRLPRSRPAAASETMTASLAPDPTAGTAGSIVQPADAQAFAALGAVPAPRSRPDSLLLADSLRGAAGPESLAVLEADAIAALAARSEDAIRLAAEAAPPIEIAPVEVAMVPAASADAARSDALAAISVVTTAPATTASESAAPLPRPRPLALAFAGSGLPAAEMVSPPEPAAPKIVPAAAPASPSPAELNEAPASAKPPVAIEPEPVEPSYEADRDVIERLTAAAARRARTSSPTGFLTMPQPAGTPGLFSVPTSADAVGSPDPMLPVNRFQPAPAAAPAAPEPEESFFSRLFANLAE